MLFPHAHNSYGAPNPYGDTAKTFDFITGLVNSVAGAATSIAGGVTGAEAAKAAAQSQAAQAQAQAQQATALAKAQAAQAAQQEGLPGWVLPVSIGGGLMLLGGIGLVAFLATRK